ncbi:MAG: RecQ family ATP-dependent DNA helicase [Flavobacteriales bacterium]|nr:RecQ family ATP-dependent DNA helicase [Flavobacteriales bacterium]
MSEAKEILKQYWGYPDFRGRQADIVEEALEGKDLLAILPTGGGKSVCFQVPAMVKEGICLVVSPLLALMKDQVDQLKARGIKASMISSAHTPREIDIILDNAIYGGTKFLYVSPERLSNELFLTRFEKMKVNYIAIDEAHCISQWGHEFRPAYRLISDIRKVKPNIPVLALTASATLEVEQDIMKQLAFKTPFVIRGEMNRSNLSLAVVHAENKLQKLLQSCQRLSGSGVIYASTRRRTKQVAEYLRSHGQSAYYYHAGLAIEQKEQLQEEWKSGKIRIIVATNAFGMGIDKSDVRFVLHADIPETPEAYLQEAGRAGRDGDQAWAVLFYTEQEIAAKEKDLKERFPEDDEIREIYRRLTSYLQLAQGSGLETSHAISIIDFSKHIEKHPRTVMNGLHILALAGYLQLSEGLQMPSRVYFSMNKQELYNFQVKYPTWDPFIQLLVRTYGGIFDTYVRVNEGKLSEMTGWDYRDIQYKLERLADMGVLQYAKKSSSDMIMFLSAVQDADYITFPKAAKLEREQRVRVRWDAMKVYIHSESCRESQLLRYFGVEQPQDCTHCDWCRKNNLDLDRSLDQVEKAIVKTLEGANMSLDELIAALPHFDELIIGKVLRTMIDEDLVETIEDDRFCLRS